MNRIANGMSDLASIFVLVVSTQIAATASGLAQEANPDALLG